MSHPNLTIEEFRDKIHTGEAQDPLVYIEAVMMGQDLRQLSVVYDLVMEIEEFSNGAPSASDWAEVVDMVTARYKYRTVSSGESIAAAKSLAEYTHAKRKHIETSDGLSSAKELSPLTEEEIDLFKEIFNDEF